MSFVNLARRVVSSLAVVAVLVAGAPALTGTGATVPLSSDSPGSGSAAPESPGTDADADADMATLPVPETAAPEEPEAAGEAPGEAEVVAELGSMRTQDYGLLGVTWEAGTAPGDLVVEVRTRTDDSWTEWSALEVDPVEEGEAERGAEVVRGGTSPTWVGESDGVAVRLLSARKAPEGVELSLIDGGTGLAGSDLELMAATAEDGVAPKPRIVTRRQWGVDRRYESSCSSPIAASRAKGIVLHHTAGSNVYSQEAAPGIVRGIHLYHTRSLNWCDVGYNFLVDKYGTIYEGRRGGMDRQIRGAHAGNWDANTYLTGISMMGNYDTAQLTTALKNAVVRLTAWRLSFFGLDAKGTITVDGGRLPIISGHRDIYLNGIRPATATACPGRYGYEWLRHLRSRAQNHIDRAAEESPEEPAVTDEPATPEEPEEPEEPVEQAPLTHRMSGTSRYATAAAISHGSFKGTGGTVFLASGEVFPDALSGGPAAARRQAPVLLTRSDALPPETVAELQRLAPQHVFVLGGEMTISEEVLAEVGKYAQQVTRLRGGNRYQTGVAISKRIWRDAGVVYIASGEKYPDALSGGALAARDGAPILLASSGNLPAAVRDELVRLSPARVVLLGGTMTLRNTVRDQVGQAVPDATVQRLSGKTRYATSAAIAKAGWSRAARAYFAAGSGFADALAGVPAAALHGAPLLLAEKTCLPDSVASTVDGLGADRRVLLGGPMTISNDAATTRCS